MLPDPTYPLTTEELVAHLDKFLSLEPWGAGITYEAGQHVVYNNKIFRAKADFTSGQSFVPANWDVILDRPGGRLAYVESYTESVNRINTAYEDYPNLATLTFTVTTRPVEVKVYLPHLTFAQPTIFTARLVSMDAATEYLVQTRYEGIAFAIDDFSLERQFEVPGTYQMKFQTKTNVNNISNQYGIRNGGGVAAGQPAAVALSAVEL